MKREYRNERIAVYWAPQYCIHTANCLNAQPEVFDSMRRPWIVLDGADADAVRDAVMSCPTGALTYERLDGEDAEPRCNPSEDWVPSAMTGLSWHPPQVVRR